MPDLVNLAERYHLLGVVSQERDDNSGLDGRTDQHVEPQVVYTTNDKEEANAICRNSGWVQDGIFIAVSGYRDSQRIPSASDAEPDEPAPRALSKHNVDQSR
jgi:hypothetical protein